METNNNSTSSASKMLDTPCLKKRTTTTTTTTTMTTISSSSSSFKNNCSLYESGDSGYITTTPNSTNTSLSLTPNLNVSSRLSPASGNSSSSNSAGGKQRRNLRFARFTSTDPWQSERVGGLSGERSTRTRSKLNTRFEQSENNYYLDYEKLIINNESLSSELDGLLRVQQQIKISSVPKTPANNNSSMQLHEILSPPPSPAVPSLSFVASEPMPESMNDVDMKLVILPQSTPHNNDQLIINNNDHRSFSSSSFSSSSLSSPKTSRNSPLENHSELSKLIITDHRQLSIPPDLIKPKKLDFSQRPKFAGVAAAAATTLNNNSRSRCIANQCGRGNVDFISLLGKESDHPRIISTIFSLLSDKDLCAVSMVSRCWQQICSRDVDAAKRRRDYVILKQNVKENLKAVQNKLGKNNNEHDNSVADRGSFSNNPNYSPRSRYARRGLLMEVQNFVPNSSSNNRPSTPTSPPVSPSKMKFHSFVKASKTLKPAEYLRPCPRCSYPCPVNGNKNIATCSRQGCSMEFCIWCSSRHTGPCKTALLATPTKRNKRLIAGSRQSKRNLRRL